jgi:tetratricopeptide (TPR) repeat protein
MPFEPKIFLAEQNQISLNALLDQLEIDLSYVGQGNEDLAKKILYRMDVVNQKISAQEALHISVTAEKAQFEYIQKSLDKISRSLIKDLGGIYELLSLREVRKPEVNYSWWYLDKTIERKKQMAIRSILLSLTIIAMIFIALVIAFNTILKPDPAVVARYNHQLSAEEFLAKNDLNQALVEVNAGMASGGSDAMLSTMRGVIEALTGKDEEAAADYADAEKIAGARNAFLEMRAETWLRIGRLDDAMMDTQEIIRNDPESAQGYYFYAKALEMRQDNSAALINYQKASELADKQGKIELNATIRMSMAVLMQSVPANITDSRTPTP